MTDRELLELAAKAVKYEVWRHPDGSLCIVPPMHTWNPLDDDGDAFRLMVDCDLTVCADGKNIVSTSQRDWKTPDVFITQTVASCKKAAVRRAIVRAAAEIGGNME